jgi:GNAT superfamily N-acetyltransferase
VVWRAEPHEAETVAALLVAFRDHLGVDWPSDNAFLAGVETLIERADTVFLLGSVDEDPTTGLAAGGARAAGVAQVRFRPGIWWAAEDCLLEDLFVREQARGSGLGRRLVDATLDLARERGCRRVELDVNEANDAALALYGGAGFSAQDDRYGGRNLFMRRHLEEERP